MPNPTEHANEELKFKIGQVVNGYKLVKKIDEGGFGQVFKVTKDDKIFFAMKLDFLEGGSAIKLELNDLSQLPKNSVFSELVCGGRKNLFQYLVLELLGDNLKGLRAQSSNPEAWSDGTWSRVAIQCLFALKTMHDTGFVHRDIKPNNFAIGYCATSVNRSRRIVLFDFGLARKFVKRLPPVLVPPVKKDEPKLKCDHLKNSSTSKVGLKSRNKSVTHRIRDPMKKLEEMKRADGSTIPEQYVFRVARAHTDFRGTLQYASPNAHLLKELGRHDDVWSLLYMVAEFFVELPWSRCDESEVKHHKNQSTVLRVFSDEKTSGPLERQHASSAKRDRCDAEGHRVL